jgi:hypothetical protein
VTNACINSDTFWPHAGPSQFMAVGGSETVARGQMGFGLVTSYQSRPLVLHLPSPGPVGSDHFVVDNQVNGTFLWSYGVSDRLELDVALPVTFIQSGSGVSAITGGESLRDTAMRDIRFGFSYALLARPRVAPDAPPGAVLARSPNGLGLALRLEVAAPTGDRDQFAGERVGVFAPSLSADYRHGRFFAAAEVGARVRATSEFAGARIGTQATIGVGVGYDILPRELLAAVLEARALPTFPEQADVAFTDHGLDSFANGKHITPAEWMLSARSAPIMGGDFAIQLGGGGAIPFDGDAPPTTPRFRFTLSLRYAPASRDTDGDGALDKDDRCPYEPAPPGSEPRDGCPHPTPAPGIEPKKGDT